VINGERKLWFLGEDGDVLWTFTSTQPMEYHYSPAIGKNGDLLVPKGSILLSIDPNGSIEWQFLADYLVNSPVVDSQGMIYFSSRNATFYSLDSNGDLRWSYNSSWATDPSIDRNGFIYIGLSDELVSFDPDGSIRWSFQADGSIYSSPAISEGVIVFITSNDTLLAIDDEGNLKWRLKVGERIKGYPAIDPDGSVYITVEGPHDGRLCRVSGEGEIEWEFLYGQFHEIHSPIVSGNGDVIFSDRWNFYSVDTFGDQNWRYSVPNHSIDGHDMAIGEDGTVYFITDSRSIVYAINTRPSSPIVTSMIFIAFPSLFIPLILIESRRVRSENRDRRGPILLLYAGGFLLLLNTILFVVLSNFSRDFLYSIGYEPREEFYMFFWLVIGMVLLLIAFLSTSDRRDSVTYGAVSMICAIVALFTMGGFIVGPICVIIAAALLVSEVIATGSEGSERVGVVEKESKGVFPPIAWTMGEMDRRSRGSTPWGPRSRRVYGVRDRRPRSDARIRSFRAPSCA